MTIPLSPAPGSSCAPCGCYENITITTQPGLSFQANDFVQLYDGNESYIYGEIVSYNSGTGELILNPCQFCGEAGTITDWTITLSGIPGPAGSSGASGSSGTSGTSGVSPGSTINLCALAGGTTHNLDTIVDKFTVQSVVYDYTITDSLVYESGTITAVWNPLNNTISYNQSSVNLGGSTNNIIFGFIISGSNPVLTLDLTVFPTSPTWKVTLVRTDLAGCPVYIPSAYIVTEGGDPITTESSDKLITE